MEKYVLGNGGDEVKTKTKTNLTTQGKLGAL